jgi:RNA polymerase sigma-70 factor (ECF subfamily)
MTTSVVLPGMQASDDEKRYSLRQAGQFRTTHWSVVLAVNHDDDDTRGRAMEELCRAYWFPVYAFVRQQGHDVDDAQDFTQGFFAHVLERDTFASAQREKGRFRSFLLGSLKNFLGHEARKRAALKRGGQAMLVPVEEEDGEERYQLALATKMSPDKLYLRSWADSLLASALALLRAEYLQAGKLDLFDKISPRLSGAADEASNPQLAALLGMSAGAVGTLVYRMRQRYGEILREQIAHTVSSPEEVDDEIRFLFSALES